MCNFVFLKISNVCSHAEIQKRIGEKKEGISVMILVKICFSSKVNWSGRVLV